MQDLHDGQAGIKTDKIGKLERAHGHVCPVFHDVVNVLLAADTGLETYNGFIDVRHQNAIGKETRRVGRGGGDLAHPLAEFHGSSEGFG